MAEITARDLDDYADAWNRHDVDAILERMTEDCVMETSAGPDVCGRRFEGRENVREGIEAFFKTYPDARWTDPNHFISGNRGVTEWVFTGTGPNGVHNEAKGCDVFIFRETKIAEKSSFRKMRNG